MKIKQQSIPELINFIKKDPIEIRFKRKNIRKCFDTYRQGLSSTISTSFSTTRKVKIKLKAPLPKFNKIKDNTNNIIDPKKILQEFTASLNNNSNSNQLAKLLDNVSSMPFQDFLKSNHKSEYSRNICKKKRNERNFEDRITSLYTKMTIQPTIKHWDCLNNNSIQRPKSSIALLPTDVKNKIIRSYNKIPYIYRGSHYNVAFYKKCHRTYDASEVYEGRYDKKKINIEEVVLNYNANAQKNFNSMKIQNFHAKKSPFIKKKSSYCCVDERFNQFYLRNGLFLGNIVKPNKRSIGIGNDL